MSAYTVDIPVYIKATFAVTQQFMRHLPITSGNSLHEKTGSRAIPAAGFYHQARAVISPTALSTGLER